MRGPVCSTWSGEMLGSAKSRHQPLARSRRHCRAIQQRNLAMRFAACVRSAVAAASIPPQIGGRHRLRRDLLIGGAREERRADCHRTFWRCGTQYHCLDGSPRHGPGQAHQCHRPCGAALCRRHAFRPRWRRRSCFGWPKTVPQAFDAAWQFFDLTDFLTWRAPATLRAPPAP